MFLGNIARMSFTQIAQIHGIQEIIKPAQYVEHIDSIEEGNYFKQSLLFRLLWDYEP